MPENIYLQLKNPKYFCNSKPTTDKLIAFNQKKSSAQGKRE